MALRIAMGTPRALPMPKPALPFWSPTTTRAEKLRFLPPLTTLVTRWMATTWSFKLLALTSMFRRTASVSLRMILDINLKFQPRFPGCCSQGFHTAVVHVSAAIEHHLLDPGRAGALGNLFSNHFCRRHVVASLEFLASILVDRTCRDQRASAAVFNDLRVDVSVRAVHAKARTLGRADHARAHAQVNPAPMRVARKFSDWFCCHDVLLLSFKRASREARAGLSARLGRGARFSSLFLQALSGNANPFLLVRIGRPQTSNIRADLPDFAAVG